MQAARRQGENLAAGVGHANCVLELGGQGPVARHSGPAIGEDFNLRATEIDHRFNCEEHAGRELHALSGSSIMENIGLVVK